MNSSGFCYDEFLLLNALMRIHTLAPTRINLVGGTLDIFPLYLFHLGTLTVNLAIARYAHCLAKTQADPCIVFISCDISPREQFRSLVTLEHKQRTRLPLLAHLVCHFAPSIGLILTTWSQVLVSASLGGSNALNIAISRALASLTHRCLNRQKLIAVARRVGALAGKFCGTGGGACIVFYCPPQHRSQAAQGLLAAGATVLSFQIARRGVCIL